MRHPQTSAEAERTLWHALEHVSGLVLRRGRPLANEDACTILRTAIERVQGQQMEDEWTIPPHNFTHETLADLKERFPDCFDEHGRLSVRRWKVAMGQ